MIWSLIEGAMILVVLIGGVFANLIPLEYRHLRWREREVGRVQMGKARAIRALFNLSILVVLTVWLVGPQHWLDVVRLVVFARVTVALGRQWRVIRRYRKRGEADRAEA